MFWDNLHRSSRSFPRRLAQVSSSCSSVARRSLHLKSYHSPHQRLSVAVRRRHDLLSHTYLGRRFLFSEISPIILIPGAFTGLLLAHWFHKCLLMVIFQNKIIYMPSLPPGSRREKLSDYARSWGPVIWKEESIKSLDGTKLALVVGQLDRESANASDRMTATKGGKKQRIILYFQGNGASLPPRTPMLSNVLRSVAAESKDEWIIIGLSYRGYWTSSGRAHQKGIEKDAQAALNWIAETYSSSATFRETDLVLWGQSIGSGVAAFAASKYLVSMQQQQQRQSETTCDIERLPHLSRLVLETPFLSIKSMLAALYPDKWVPYRHLWPFLRSWWDSEEALKTIAAAAAASTDRNQHPLKILMVVASRDEIVPAIQADQIEKLCHDLKLDAKRENVLGALHTQASTLETGKNVIVRFLAETSR